MYAVILKTLVTKLVTEKVLTKLFILIAEHLAKKTKTKIDDQLVEEIKKALDQ